MTPEGQVLRAITDLLTAEGIWWIRMNTGAVKTDTRFFRFGRPGCADILAMPIGSRSGRVIPLWLEVKAGKGRQSEAQKMFEVEVKSNGMLYFVAYSADDVIELLKGFRS